MEIRNWKSENGEHARIRTGFSLIELLMVVAVGSIIVAAVSVFVGRGFAVSREHFEQARITEEARIHLKRMANTIRNAQDVDVNGDGVLEIPPDLSWLEVAEPYKIVFYANVDSNLDTVERISYWIDSGSAELKRGVTPPTPGDPISYNLADEVVNVLSRSVRNREVGTPLFEYPIEESGTATRTRVKITLVVDVDVNQYPPAAVVTTEVVPRLGLFGGSGPGPGIVSDLQLTKQHEPGSLSNILHKGVNTRVRYYLIVHNDGPDTASGIRVVDPVPNNLLFNASETDPGPGGQCLLSQQGGGGPKVECTLPTLNAGATHLFELVFDVDNPFLMDCAISSVTNNATVQSDQTDPELSDNNSQDVNAVTCFKFDINLTDCNGCTGTITWTSAFTNELESRTGVRIDELSMGDPLNKEDAIAVLLGRHQLTGIPEQWDAQLKWDVTDQRWEFEVQVPIFIGQGGIIYESDQFPVQEACVNPPGSVDSVEELIAWCAIQDVDIPLAPGPRRVCDGSGSWCTTYLPVFRYTFPANPLVSSYEPEEDSTQYYIKTVGGGT